MNAISALRFLRDRLFRRQPLTRMEIGGDTDEEDGDNLAAVTAPHGPRPRSGGAMARPKAPEDLARR